jgi:uncharacterized protein (DUF2141 family)
MKKHFVIASASAIATLIGSAFILSAAIAGSNGGYISGTVKLPKSVTNWQKVIVLVCAEADEMCAKPVAVIKAKPALSSARSAPFTSPKLAAGKYTVYAINDKNGDMMHDHESEELGGYFKEGTFDSILIEPPARGVTIDIIGL